MTLEKFTSKIKPYEVKRMIEIRNQKLYIDGIAIGDEEYLLHVFNKANKIHEAESIFKESDV